MIRCKDCKRLFEPQFEKQWYCEPCRAQGSQSVVVDSYVKTVREWRLPVQHNDTLEKAILSKFRSIYQAANAIGVSQGAVKGWVNGYSPKCPEWGLRLCQALGVGPEILGARFLQKLKNGNEP